MVGSEGTVTVDSDWLLHQLKTEVRQSTTSVLVIDKDIWKLLSIPQQMTLKYVAGVRDVELKY